MRLPVRLSPPWFCRAGRWGDDDRIGTLNNITPAATGLPAPYTSIRDHLFVRAIVLDNHVTRAALVGVDLIVIDEPLWQEVSQKLARELGETAEDIALRRPTLDEVFLHLTEERA